jgi:hypothetical protein
LIARVLNKKIQLLDFGMNLSCFLKFNIFDFKDFCSFFIGSTANPNKKVANPNKKIKIIFLAINLANPNKNSANPNKKVANPNKK